MHTARVLVSLLNNGEFILTDRTFLFMYAYIHISQFMIHILSADAALFPVRNRAASCNDWLSERGRESEKKKNQQCR